MEVNGYAHRFDPGGAAGEEGAPADTQPIPRPRGRRGVIRHLTDDVPAFSEGANAHQTALNRQPKIKQPRKKKRRARTAGVERELLRLIHNYRV
jgi:hypothetical protein